jgi:dipeptide/tripeptide permease
MSLSQRLMDSDQEGHPMDQANEADVALGQKDGSRPAGYVSRHPIGFWFFFWGELAERSSYYGMRAILLLYMIETLGFSDGTASSVMAYFIAGCYFLPLVGGYLADNVFGKYWTIIGFSLPYILGHVILGFPSVPCLAVALALLAMGSGVIKPNISTLMGMTYDQQRPGQEKLRSDAFAMFYGAINIGSALSSFAMPLLRTRYGYAVAFLFPAVLMAIAFAIFAAGKRHYAVETITRSRATPQEKQQKRIVLGRILGLFVVVAFFWSIFDQAASTWTLFARDYLDLHLLRLTLQPDMIQGFNPILIVLLLPPVTYLWHVLARRGLELRATDKMMVGFLLTTLCMGVMAAAGFLGIAKIRGSSRLGYHFILLGEKGHEVIREVIEGEAGSVVTVKTVDDVAKLPYPGSARVAYLTRTRLTSEDTALNYIREGYSLVLLGQSGNGGVLTQALKAAPGRVFVVDSPEGARELAVDDSGKVAYLTQTKLLDPDSKAIVAALKARSPRIVAVSSNGAELVASLRVRYPGIVVPPKASVLWQILAYVIITVAEICISVVGLELAFTAAPKSMKSFVTACWLLTVFFGNILNAQITPFFEMMPPGRYFGMLTLMMIPVTLAFSFIARRFNREAAQWREEEAETAL